MKKKPFEIVRNATVTISRFGFYYTSLVYTDGRYFYTQLEIAEAGNGLIRLLGQGKTSRHDVMYEIDTLNLPSLNLEWGYDCFDTPVLLKKD